MLNAREHKLRIGWNRGNIQSKIPELTFDDGVEGRKVLTKNKNKTKKSYLVDK